MSERKDFVKAVTENDQDTDPQSTLAGEIESIVFEKDGSQESKAGDSRRRNRHRPQNEEEVRDLLDHLQTD